MQPTIKAHKTALIAQDAILTGDITIGAGCIIHPRCSILATAGPIELGDNCVVEELAVLENTGHVAESEAQGVVMRIGPGNQFSVGCQIQALSVGADNTFHPRCRVPSSISVSDNCIIGAGVTVTPSASITATEQSTNQLSPHTVLYGALAERHIVDPSNPETQTGAIREVEDRIKQDRLAFLRDNLPKHVRLRAV